MGRLTWISQVGKNNVFDFQIFPSACFFLCIPRLTVILSFGQQDLIQRISVMYALYARKALTEKFSEHGLLALDGILKAGDASRFAETDRFEMLLTESDLKEGHELIKKIVCVHAPISSYSDSMRLAQKLER